MSYNTRNVVTPVEGKVVMLDYYWLCKDGDPTQAIFFGESPQCNKNQLIVERAKDYTERETGWSVEVVYIPISYRSQSFPYLN